MFGKVVLCSSKLLFNWRHNFKNIAFAEKEDDINLKKIDKILEICALKNFVNSLADGINTKVGDRGVRVSGGQKQRIGIARALYNNPKILFLDEAMSNLDKENENLITKNLKKIIQI